MKLKRKTQRMKDAEAIERDMGILIMDQPVPAPFADWAQRRFGSSWKNIPTGTLHYMIEAFREGYNLRNEEVLEIIAKSKMTILGKTSTNRT